jgi:hypothetical protein
MNKKLLINNPGPFSNFLLNEINNYERQRNKKNKHNQNNNKNDLSKMRFDKSKKNNSKDKDMSGKAPNIKLIDSNASNNVKVKNETSINNVNLIRDSDSDSIATAEPENDSDVSPIATPVKLPKKSFSKMPTIDNDEFKYFTNNKKQKPIVQKQESEDEYSDEEDESEDQDSEDDISDSESEPSVKQKKMSSREIEQKKQEYLIKLLALEKKGVNLTKSYSLKSSLEELEFEYNTQQKAMEMEASVHFQQKILMAAVTGVEFLNKKFDPIGAKLDGWSESVMDNINDYEEIFKKLHEKYSQRASMPPELQLLVTLVGSGFMFHLTNSLFKSSLPGLGDVLKTNPDIMSNIMGAMGKAMNNAQGLTPGATSSSNTVPQMPQMPQVPQMPQMPQVPQMPQMPQTSTESGKKSSQSSNMPDFTGPSMNLSSLLNTYQSGPDRPIVQQAPKMKEVDETDRFSVASSSDYSELEDTTKTINMPTVTKGKGKGKIPKGKSIKI